jgi:hypothetical protein
VTHPPRADRPLPVARRRGARPWVLAALACATLAAACSSGSLHPAPLATDPNGATVDRGQGNAADDAATDAGDGDGGAPGDASGGDADAATDAVTVCNDLTADGPLVAETAGSGPPPAATGGTLFQGTYWLTARANYGGTPDARLVQRTLVIGATGFGVAEGVATSGDAGDVVWTSREGTWSLSSPEMLAFDVACPSPVRVDHVRFAADGPHLTLLITNEAVESYELQ